jgi:hypothetical protein
LLSRATVAIGSLMTTGQWQRSFCCRTEQTRARAQMGSRLNRFRERRQR